MVVGHGGGRPARRAAGRVRGIVRIHRRAGMPVGEFRGHGLAHDHAIGRARQRHAGGVGERHLAGEDGRIVARRHVVGVDDVLHADRHAADQPCRCLVRRARLGERQFRIEMGPGMEDRLARPRCDRGRSAPAPPMSARRWQSPRPPRWRTTGKVRTLLMTAPCAPRPRPRAGAHPHAAGRPAGYQRAIRSVPLVSGQRHAGHPEIGPEQVERGLAGALQARRRLARAPAP